MVGVETRNDITGPLPAPSFLKSAATGIIPQEQSGRGIPNSDAFKTDGKLFFERELLDSPAFRTLSRGAMLVYLDFLAKRQMAKDRVKKKWFVENNGKIVYP